MTSLTTSSILERVTAPTGTQLDDLDLEVPVRTGAQAQGDVLIIPVAHEHKGARIPDAGVTVVTGESTGGNAHILHRLDGDSTWHPAADADTALTQGYLTVPDGGVAVLIHTEEHGILGIGPGRYEIRRQREYAGEWRRIAD